MDDPMVIELQQIAKRFNTWIFKEVTYTFDSHRPYGIAGSNGTGKSTLLKIISGYMTPTSGEVVYRRATDVLSQEDLNTCLCYTAPYISLIEELTVSEAIRFQRRFKPYQQDMDLTQVLKESGLAEYEDRFLNQLSSGLMQRLKLSLALMASSEILLLDEPTSFLDEKSRQWFESMLSRFGAGRLTLIATNDPEDIALCAQVLDIEEYQ